MSNERFTYLIKGWLNERLTSEEIDEFMLALQDEHFTALLGDEIVASLTADTYSGLDRSEDRERIFRQKQKRVQDSALRGRKKSGSYKLIVRWAAAAVIIGICAAGYFYLIPKSQKQIGNAEAQVTYPKTTLAVITLPDGTKIRTDTLKDEKLIQQYGLFFMMTDSGSLVFNPLSLGVLDTTSLIKIDNPRGSASLQLKLSDGSRVWLNSQSSITYSPAFKAHSRDVEISGEAYFEVAKDRSRKFFVKSKSLTTEVLGTHFDMRAYEDEGVSKVTLLEGSVKIYNNKTAQSRQIVPNQQASVAAHTISVKSTNIQDVMAWKN